MSKGDTMTLRCGVVGLGRGKSFVKAFADIEGCEVVAVCDPRPAAFEGMSGLATHTDYEQFLDEKLDVVALVSPGPAHAGQAVAALERGFHVLSETPCVYSLDEARAVVAAVEKSGLKYMLGENYIWMSWFAPLAQMAAEGRFGEIVYAEGDYTHDCRGGMLFDEGGAVPLAERHKHPNARPAWRASDLPPLFYCSHTLGPMLRLVGSRIVSAYGVTVAGKAAADVVPFDFEAGLFATESGTAIRLSNGFAVAHPMAFYYNFVGTRGSAKVMKVGNAPAQCWTACDARGGKWEEQSCEFFQGLGGRSDLEAMLADFVASVRDDTKPPIDVHESMDMQLPGIIAHESGLKGGVKLDVPDSRRFGEAPRPPQLRMEWPERLLDSPPSPKLPPGYRLRCATEADAGGFIELMAKAGFSGWDAERLAGQRAKVVPDGHFVIEHQASGRLVATAMAQHAGRPDQPYWAEMGWVAADPAHKGKGLGLAVCAAVTARLLRAGYRRIHLLTDDWRLPALKTYLKLGYEPVLTGEGMAERWRKLGEALGWPI